MVENRIEKKKTRTGRAGPGPGFARRPVRVTSAVGHAGQGSEPVPVEDRDLGLRSLVEETVVLLEGLALLQVGTQFALGVVIGQGEEGGITGGVNTSGG